MTALILSDERKRDEFLSYLLECNGDVNCACKAVGLTSAKLREFYKSPEFRSDLQDVQELVLLKVKGAAAAEFIQQRDPAYAGVYARLMQAAAMSGAVSQAEEYRPPQIELLVNDANSEEYVSFEPTADDGTTE